MAGKHYPQLNRSQESLRREFFPDIKLNLASAYLWGEKGGKLTVDVSWLGFLSVLKATLFLKSVTKPVNCQVSPSLPASLSSALSVLPSSVASLHTNLAKFIHKQMSFNSPMLGAVALSLPWKGTWCRKSHGVPGTGGTDVAAEPRSDQTSRWLVFQPCPIDSCLTTSEVAQEKLAAGNIFSGPTGCTAYWERKIWKLWLEKAFASLCLW